MLRHRQSLKSKPALSHRKSTSSARSVVLEHLDPAVAQRDAHIAAHQAFARAQDRSSVGMALFPPPPSPSHLRQPYLQDGSTRNHSPEPSATDDNKPGIPRRQSVRFVGPCTVNNRGVGSKQRPQTPASGIRGALDPANIAESPNKHALAVPTLHHPQARSGTSFSINSSKTVGDYLQSLAAAEDVYTPEDDIASVPSSYRRLRRSKSLHPSITAGQGRDSGDSYLLPPIAARREVRTSMSMRTLNPSPAKENIKPQKVPTLKAPKSMSFLKGRRGRISSITIHDNASITQLNTAPTQIPLKHKTSSFFGSRAKREDTRLRKTLRSTNSNADLLQNAATADTGLPLPKNAKGSLRVKARKASKTLKNKFMNLFSSTKDGEGADFPDQHIKSHKTHADGFVSYFDGHDGDNHREAEENLSSYYNHANRSGVLLDSQVGRVCSRKASLPAFGGQLWGETASEEKATDDKSRVTSWTNSGPSTLTSEQQLAWVEWEKQRLSIIKENGTHCPSPSLRRQAICKHILQSQESLVGQPIPPGPTVDSQRVYAALMERLAETTQLAQVVEQQRKSLEETTPDTLHKPAFEDYEDHSAKPAPLTVRRSTSSTVRDTERNTPREDASTDHAGGNTKLSPPVTLTPWNGGCSAPEGHGIPTSERTNAFFGSPETHLFRTISPYRRALRKSMEEEDQEMHGRSSGDRIISECGTEIRRPDQACYDDAYSESVYSTDDPASGSMNHMQSLTGVVDAMASSTGNATTSLDGPMPYPPTSKRDASAVSSIDWKTWLSANVARFEPSPSPPPASRAEVAEPAMESSFVPGHVRERAQIDDDDKHGFARLGVPPSYTPLPEISTPRALPRFDGRMSLCELQDPFDGPLPSPELPPPIPPRSPLRKNYQPAVGTARSSKTVQDGEAAHAKVMDHERTPVPLRPATRLTERDANADLQPCTPTPKPTRMQKKRSGFLYTPSVAASSNAGTSPGLTAAVQKQFGPATKPNISTGRHDDNKENEVVLRDGNVARKNGLFGSSTASSSEERSAKSKRMVDVFLSSRRKRMVSSETDSPAFL